MPDISPDQPDISPDRPDVSPDKADQAPVAWTTVTIDHDDPDKWGHSVYAPKGVKDIHWPWHDWLFVVTDKGKFVSRDQGESFQPMDLRTRIIYYWLRLKGFVIYLRLLVFQKRYHYKSFDWSESNGKKFSD